MCFRSKAFDIVLCVEDNTISIIHACVQFGYTKRIYLIEKPLEMRSLKDLNGEDPILYIEIPDNRLNYSLYELCYPKTSSFWSKKKSDDSEKQEFLWSLVNDPDKWKNLQLGDILDIKVCLKARTPNAAKVDVHLIPWYERWDDKRLREIGQVSFHAKKKQHLLQKTSYGASTHSSSFGYGNSKPEQIL
ncbi:hypothetical protein RFI_02816 [Reticulomyxa filosa]|uniref:Uncharacterized protein n=1 Tax=Reticulomyxa filosa TaxID=46433 RepID=X6P878_RETFI|nr:hypothetical protein RFI_02816 [Reticulomyxa filosa]|eukprot:ETO34279.1 hypothetical protein RFI_02816 [Reticulomyxa filosa]